jgi:ATP-dependent DNA helicase RecG
MEAARSTTRASGPNWRPTVIGTGEEIGDRQVLLSALVVWPAQGVLDRPLTTLKGVGPKLASASSKDLGVESLRDMLLHLPRLHRNLVEVTPLREVRAGEEATVAVEVRSAKVRPTRKRRLTILEAEVVDAEGAAGKIVWFNRPWLSDRLEPGTRLLARGKIGKNGFAVAEHEFIGAGELPGGASGGADHETAEDRSAGEHWIRPGRPGGTPPSGIHTTGLVPVYPASERVRPPRLREWAWQVAGLANALAEPIPGRERATRGLPSSADSIVGAHLPPDAERLEQARQALAFEELSLYQATLAVRRRRRRSSVRAVALAPPDGRMSDWIGSLPFELTADQRRAVDEIDRDLTGEVPMQRLLMGEVGSGKTVVALYAMLRAVYDGGQAALMAPTETLAEQHHRTLEGLAGPDGPRVVLLTGSVPDSERDGPLNALADGDPLLVVGTHALIESSVEFSRLRIAVIDEQHRFGVRQRAELDRKGEGGSAPHSLHMTATPIPRTLSLTAYGDLDTTSLRGLPSGRKPVQTRIVEDGGRSDAYGFIRDRLREGRQAFIVCPLVSESVMVEAKAAEQEASRLAAGEFRDFSLAVLHGQQSAEEKQRTMLSFAGGDIDVLVATSVIEVGIDVPNATVMVIEGAERFGLSQLHQLRGRVGRGEHASHCLLFADARSEAAKTRLEAIETERDGFRLAEVDLTIRGEGELLGTRQHGLPRFLAASLPDDLPLLLEAREMVERLLDTGSVEAEILIDAARMRFGDERAQRLAA